MKEEEVRVNGKRGIRGSEGADEYGRLGKMIGE